MGSATALEQFTYHFAPTWNLPGESESVGFVEGYIYDRLPGPADLIYLSHLRLNGIFPYSAVVRSFERLCLWSLIQELLVDAGIVGDHFRLDVTLDLETFKPPLTLELPATSQLGFSPSFVPPVTRPIEAHSEVRVSPGCPSLIYVRYPKRP